MYIQILESFSWFKATKITTINTARMWRPVSALPPKTKVSPPCRMAHSLACTVDFTSRGELGLRLFVE